MQIILWVLVIIFIIGLVLLFANKFEYFNGNNNLQFYNVGNKQYTFNITSFKDIKEATSMTLLDDNSIIITAKNGMIYYVNANNQTIILDISKTNSNFTGSGEQGLLSSVINPNDESELYISYTIRGNDNFKVNLLVDQYQINKQNNTINLTKIKNIITIPFRETYHHAGSLAYSQNNLYLSTGDGGPQNDPYNEAQNMNSYYGKILKINPNTNQTQIIAMGLRNPWGISIDNNKMFIGNAGADNVESVYLIESLPNPKPYNFGWSYFEGSRQNKPGRNFNEFDPPIFEYPHQGHITVIGGYYVPRLNAYIFGDYDGTVKAIRYINGKWTQIGDNKVNTMILAFGYNKQTNEVYVLGNDRIYRLQNN